MEITAKLRYSKVSPQKSRLVADLIRGKKVEDAINILSFLNKKSAKIVNQVLKSAMANAEDKEVDDVDSLRVSKIMIDGGPTWKRQLPRGRGRVNRIIKRTSHITLVLS